LTAKSTRQQSVGEQARLQIEISNADKTLQTDVNSIRQQLVELSEQMREAEASSTHVIVSPLYGRVNAIQVKEGERVDPSLPLMTISPLEGDLIGELFLPSRAIAFVETGQSVNLKYDALPYQKFGLGQGTIRSISATTFHPSELGVITTNLEPLYRIEVDLAEQAIGAFNREIPLQSGMELTADIILERRRLSEWLLASVVKR